MSMDQKINANRGTVNKNLVYGRIFLTGTQETYPDMTNTYRKLKHKISFGRRKKTYGSKGKSRIE